MSMKPRRPLTPSQTRRVIEGLAASADLPRLLVLRHLMKHGWPERDDPAYRFANNGNLFLEHPPCNDNDL